MFLDYLSIIRFVVENISTVESVDDINARFSDSIKDITNEDELHLAELMAMNIPGHENYLFKFKESDKLFGEFNVDLIPLYPAASLFGQKQLANFRAQLFADGLLSSLELKRKNKEIFNYITGQYGQPNQPPIARDNSKLLTETYGTPIDCWHFHREGRNYLITFYLFKGDEIRTYLSFSISLVFNQPV